MKTSSRFWFQSLFWLTLWLIFWFFEDGNLEFIKKNLLIFISQIVLLAALIYYAAPKLLLQKKYGKFLFFSAITILFLCFLSSGIETKPIGPPRPFFGNLPKNISNDLHPERPISRFFINLLILSISTVTATFLETLSFAQKKEEENIKSKNEKLQTELKLLKSQINPHFLFNTLNNIYALSAINTQKTQDSISYLSNMLRYVLYECDQPLVPIYKEVEYIENYIKLFTTKSSKKYPITTRFNISNKATPIAPMLLIPFLENAIKHSNIEKITGTFINILITSDDNQIYFEIENSISDLPVIKDEVGGIGLENVNKRLTILYPNKHELSINNGDASFKASLKLFLK
ncbi:histidine kinase [Cellulophaga sp. HaHaR_3_176]|uniref:sensor histidine kinase n=1 Tax=Cellulophaga sp. HaHaR_3_176 TaxID=1942464 RepID=UPI001C1F7123|nr:histidine kinase [Cellulophaga sp. HaHaR_3_176]QWX85282.1 histidine kinase [Cellulophaga sp. HaHaR_3_176]